MKPLNIARTLITDSLSDKPLSHMLTVLVFAKEGLQLRGAFEGRAQRILQDHTTSLVVEPFLGYYW